jgi:hypothetical protein
LFKEHPARPGALFFDFCTAKLIVRSGMSRLHCLFASPIALMLFAMGRSDSWSASLPILLPPSPVIQGIDFDTNHLQRAAPGSDLWPITWADNDELYTSWGDGGGFGGTDQDGRVAVGIGMIKGGPEDWIGVNILGGKNPVFADRPFPGKANGILSVGGILYLHVIEQGHWWRSKIGRSIDRGRHWSFREGSFDSNHWDFSEPEGAFSDFTFLNFGKDYRGARDRYVYIYSQDERRKPDGSMADITDRVALLRAPKTRLMDHGSYEYFAGLKGGKPKWTRNIGQRAGVFSRPGGVGFAVRVDYNPFLKRYLLSTFHQWDGSWGLYDAPEPWGPWTTVAVFNQWIDSKPKFGFTFPSKWMSPDGKTMYLVFSGTGIYDSFNLVKATLRLN